MISEFRKGLAGWDAEGIIEKFLFFSNSFVLFSYFDSVLLLIMSLISAIKQRMEKDVDEVGKIARLAKSKVEQLEKDVILFLVSSTLAVLHIKCSHF